MIEKSCFFIGHRDAPWDLFPMMQQTVNAHILEYGVTEFIVGGHGAFDRMAARAVISAKRKQPGIILRLLLPYHPAERPVETPPGFDSTYYPPGMERVPRRFAISRVNRYMVEHVNYLISYAHYPGSNARTLVEYAEHKGVLISNIELPHR